MIYEDYNPNPLGKRTGDCVVRALCKVFNEDWHKVYAWLFVQGDILCEMPSSNNVWGTLLRKKGFVREVIPNDCDECYTVEDFCKDHPTGTYVLALKNHVCTVISGNLYDSWDSSCEAPLYFWHKEEEK